MVKHFCSINRLKRLVEHEIIQKRKKRVKCFFEKQATKSRLAGRGVKTSVTSAAECCRPVFLKGISAPRFRGNLTFGVQPRNSTFFKGPQFRFQVLASFALFSGSRENTVDSSDESVSYGRFDGQGLKGKNWSAC